jgi:pilus assembly protein Flp/PilA
MIGKYNCGDNLNLKVFVSDFKSRLMSRTHDARVNEISSNPALQEMLIMKTLAKLFRDESGATAIEYGLIAALIAVVIVTALTTVGGNLKTTFTSVANNL